MVVLLRSLLVLWAYTGQGRLWASSERVSWTFPLDGVKSYVLFVSTTTTTTAKPVYRFCQLWQGGWVYILMQRRITLFATTLPSCYSSQYINFVRCDDFHAWRQSQCCVFVWQRCNFQ